MSSYNNFPSLFVVNICLSLLILRSAHLFLNLPNDSFIHWMNRTEQAKPHPSLKCDRRVSVDVFREMKSSKGGERRHSSELVVSTEGVKNNTGWNVTA